MTTRRRFLSLSGAALAACVLPWPASAQAWPSRPIRAIVPFAKEIENNKAIVKAAGLKFN
jgi:hypothetical protein